MTYIDRTGTAVIRLSAEFELANEFSEGLASVSKNGKYGFIDRQGDLVIPAKYDRVSSFHDGIAAVFIR